MKNDNETAVFCEKCGANLALVGKMHNCRSIPASQPAVANSEPLANAGVANTPMANSTTKQVANRKTYQHRNAAERREYMREYMRKKRTFGKGKGP